MSNEPTRVQTFTGPGKVTVELASPKPQTTPVSITLLRFMAYGFLILGLIRILSLFS